MKRFIEELENILNIYAEKGTIIIMGDINSQVFPRSFSGTISSSDQCLINLINDYIMVSVGTLGMRTGADTTFV